MATNRIESLDPALLRPGRIDRKIEFPMPDHTTKRLVRQRLLPFIFPTMMITGAFSTFIRLE